MISLWNFFLGGGKRNIFLAAKPIFYPPSPATPHPEFLQTIFYTKICMHSVNFRELSSWKANFILCTFQQTDHILTKAKHCVMLSRPEPAGNKMPHSGRMSALVQHPAFRSSLPAISQAWDLEVSGQLLIPKAKGKSHLMTVLQIFCWGWPLSETIWFLCKCFLLTLFSWDGWRPSYTFLHNPREF